MSVLGIDLGKKRIGLAMGTVIAEEYKTLKVLPPAQDFLDFSIGTQQAIDELVKIVNKERIETVVVGLPVYQSGDLSKDAQLMQDFIDKLKKILEIPVETMDEALTSFAAEEILKDEGASRDEIKDRIDQVAAKLILQEYLEDF